MRFDDSLDTVLAGDLSDGSGVQFAWRQLVDLIGRGRVPPHPRAMLRLRAIRGKVPAPIRAASARGIERGAPPVELVALFVEDELTVAAPVVRSAALGADQWIALLPAMSPAVRSLLRNRRDLAPAVERALASYGPTDFVIPGAVAEPTEEVASEPTPIAADDSFVTLGDAASALPVVAEARRVADAGAGFRIADVLERIEARRDDHRPREPKAVVPATAFSFETDAAGVIRWVDGAARSAVVGVTLDPPGGAAQVDGIAAGAYRRRAQFTDARLSIPGASDAAGEWRISGTPCFDHATGRFTGYRGLARRPQAHESALPLRRATPATDALRQLVHELRTPTNAITGFAEMIESELLGPVAPAYRERAREIRLQTAELVGAIDDIDLAARIESHVLDLHFGAVALMPILTRAVSDLAPLLQLRGATLALAGDDARVDGDDRAVERLLSRLLAALAAAASPGEVLTIAVRGGRDLVTVTIDRPRALAPSAGDTLFSAEADSETETGGPPLGSAFAFRLARNLSVELGGSLIIDADRLTLRLRAAVDGGMEQATV